jgi:Family of unknown function (DUF6152)
MRQRVVLTLVFGLLLVTSPALAHHSFQAEFNAKQIITLKGTVSKVDWINPHVFVYVNVKDESGKVTTWSLESLPVLFLHRSGLTKPLLLGSGNETVEVNAFPAKDGTKAFGFLTKITYPDGHFYDLMPGADERAK